MKPLFTFTFLFLFFGSLNAQQALDSLLQKLRNTGSDSARAYLCIDIALEAANGNSRDAMKYARQGMEISEKIPDNDAICCSYSAIGGVYYNTGNFDEALSNYRKALELAGSNINNQASIYSNTGNVYSEMGKTEKALSCYLESLKRYESEKNEKGIKGCYENLALTMEDLNQFDKAREYFSKSISLSIRMKDEKALAGSYINIGNELKRLNQYDSARYYYLKGLALAEKTRHKRWQANALNGLGMIGRMTGHFTEALNYYNRSMKIHRDDINDEMGVANSFHNIGELYYAQHDLTTAIRMMQVSLGISSRINAFTIEKQCLSDISQIYAEKKMFDSAYLFHVDFLELKDSLSTLESSKQIAEMQAKYETEKKENEIRGLTQKNEIQDLQLNKNRIILYAAISGVVLLAFMALMIYKRYQLKRKANTQLEFQNSRIHHQKAIIEEKNKDITDSIIYAKRIQDAILPPVETIQSAFPDSFVLFQPKDIVSGDFYYFNATHDTALIAAVDCTGHGVPGAFMSIVGHNVLNRAINEFGLQKPGDILGKVNELLAETLHSSNRERSVKDGMDINLCSIDINRNKLYYSGAYNPLWLIRNNDLTEIKADKFPLGALESTGYLYRNNEVEILKGDCIYLFTDGYADQFGGKEGKKFKYRNMKDLLLRIRNEPMEKQGGILNEAMNSWKGELEQVDDILIVGIRI